MANLPLVSQDHRLVITRQDVCVPRKDPWAKQQGVGLGRRARWSPETGKPLVTDPQGADVGG
jgi:hypothetical protein